MHKQSFLQAVFSSAIWNIAGKCLTLVRHIIIAAVIGLATQLDIFFMAMAFLGILIMRWAGVIEYIATPQLVKAESAGDSQGFARMAGSVFAVAMLSGIVLTALILLFREPVSQLAIGFDAPRRAALADAFVWLMPVMLLTYPLACFHAILRAKRLFSITYHTSVLQSVVLLSCIIIAPRHPAVLLWSLSASVVASFLYSAFFAARYARYDVNPFTAPVLRLFHTAPALLVLYGTVSAFVIIDRIFASFLAPGAISALAYAMTLATAIPGLLGIATPTMTVFAEKKDAASRAASLNDLFSLIIFLGAGITAFLVVAGADMVALLFERGAFAATDTVAVAAALTAFSFMAVPVFAMKPIDQIFQLEKRIAMMVRRTLIVIVVAAVLNYVAIFMLGWGIFGLALATAISTWLITGLGIIGLMRIGYPLAIARHCRWAAWCGGFVLAAMGGVVLLPDIWLPVDIALAGGVIGMALLLAGLTWRGHERGLLRGVIRRVLAGIRP